MTPARPSAVKATVSLVLALLSIGLLGGGSILLGNAWSTPLPGNNKVIVTNNGTYSDWEVSESTSLATIVVWPVTVCLSVLCLAVATYLRGKEVSRAMACWWLAIVGLASGLWLIVRNGWDLRPQLLALILCYAAFVWWFVLRGSPAPGRAKAAVSHPPEVAAVDVHATAPEGEGTHR